MTLIFSQSDFWELFGEAIAVANEGSDLTWLYPSALGQGYWREIVLGAGLELTIADYQLDEDMVVTCPERPHPLEFCVYHSQREFALYGSGLAPDDQSHTPANTRNLLISVHLAVDRFRTVYPADHLPPQLLPLLRADDREYFTYAGGITAAMQTTVRQMVQCPYSGITQRLYLESKVLELVAAQLDQLLCQPSRSPHALKPEDVDRIHSAAEILLQRLDNPPSLLELARQVGLNDCTLKRGFRQVFGTTAFGYLHHHRLEQARQLLESRLLNVTEVAHKVGFSDRSHFAAAFRKKFGTNPSSYLRAK